MPAYNVGTLDAAIRWILAAVLGVVSLALDIPMLVSLLIAMIAMGMAASALLHFCPLYAALGISTRHDGPMPSAGHS